MLKNLRLVFLLFSICGFSQQNIFDVARSGNVNDIKELMKINPDTINIKDKNGYDPLTLACYRGNTKVAFFLANTANDINGSSKFGTPLMAAVYKNYDAIVKVLLERKVKVNTVDANGTSALHYAVINRNEIIVKYLVNYGANVLLKDNRGKTALDYAKISGEEAIIKLLKKKSS
ncbi:ankyrin repeat domain-containing protein [Ichthyenterobacterium sp. W332]|uniref:Ankyrin repeat domain-containing protein n=1 Tax=Microcosmobacter mediterraneus TaxID=3075607 RepID=A0ABU2YH70_9FLAO|nr:ankyrin repeat domain-containing protein [Ichthyenterobacterium sp. W332]MDT0557246.1 ankyrin repeat domain-containing protein [Ichthyenterobacterium sp. W332]